MTRIEPPRERECERCRRREVWDPDRETWIQAPDTQTPGQPHCLHYWDISGAYNPVVE